MVMQLKHALAGMEMDSVTGNIKFGSDRSAIKSAAVIKIDGGKKTLAGKVNP